MNALILTSGGLIAAKIMSAWLQTGNSVAALWIGSKNLRRFLRRDRALGTAWSAGTMARRYGIPVRRNPDLSTWTDADIAIRKLHADVLITAVTGQIVPETILSRFSGRAVNFHGSVLPHYRGPNPRAAMILDEKADLHGGITLHCLSRGIDKGDIIGVRRVPYDAKRGFIYWEVCLARAAGSLVRSELQSYLNGTLRPSPQAADSGSYRKVRSSELTLSSTSPAFRIKWLCDNLGASGQLRFCSQGKKIYRVSHFIREIGPQTFEVEKIDEFTIEFDAADVRVRVARHRRPAPAWRTAIYWLEIARSWALQGRGRR